MRALDLAGLRAQLNGAFVAGFAGSSTAWPPALDAEATRAIDAILDTLVTAHDRLWVISGGTDLGVPGLVHRACARRGIPVTGITATEATAYPLAPMTSLLLVGARFGDESATFVELGHAFWLMGGGAQATREMALARSLGKPVTALRGFGGAADRLDAATLPGAVFVGPRPG